MVPVWLASCVEPTDEHRLALERAGVRFLAAELYDGRIALPELLEDMAAQGVTTVLVEGGAHTASAFLTDGLVDRIALFRGPVEVGEGGIPAPIDAERIGSEFRLVRQDRFGDDHYAEWTRSL